MSRAKAIGVRELVVLVDRDSPFLPLGRQCELLGIPRGSLYYPPLSMSADDEAMMRLIDELYTKHPFYGSRRIAKVLSRELKEAINRKRIQRLMGIMGIEAIYPKPHLSQNTAWHVKYPYLLKGLNITAPNQVWGTDITYIRLKNGFVYLVAYIDWYSRLVLAWRLSTTLETRFCLEAANEALNCYGIPGIINSDQGVQFTSQEYIQLWEKSGAKISLDGRGRALDNIFTERLWRNVKYEEVYLKDYDTVSTAQTNLSEYFNFYNTERPHQSLDYRTPREIHFAKH